MPDDDSMVEMALKIASSSPATPVPEIAAWIRENSLRVSGVTATADILLRLASNDPVKLERWLDRGPSLLRTTQAALEDAREVMQSLAQRKGAADEDAHPLC